MHIYLPVLHNSRAQGHLHQFWLHGHGVQFFRWIFYFIYCVLYKTKLVDRGWEWKGVTFFSNLLFCFYLQILIDYMFYYILKKVIFYIYILKLLLQVLSNDLEVEGELINLERGVRNSLKTKVKVFKIVKSNILLRVKKPGTRFNEW